LTGFSRGTTLQVFDPEKEEDRDVITKSISNRSILNDLGGSEMRSKKTLRTLSLILTIATLALPSTAIFAAKPVRIAIIATYRNAPGDGALGDGADYVDGDPGVSAVIGSNGQFSLFASGGRTLGYDLSMPVDPDGAGACAAGATPSVSGPGNLRVTPFNTGGFQQIPIGVSQAGLATTNLTGADGDNYLLRFRSDDPLDSSANCSTDATITRIDADTWEVEVFAGDDIARLLTNHPKGPGWDNLGHYSATFKITLVKK
jgi:hypothetical protein